LRPEPPMSMESVMGEQVVGTAAGSEAGATSAVVAGLGVIAMNCTR
jgi:hypothetical protein